MRRIVLLIASSLLLAGCGGDDQSPVQAAVRAATDDGVVVLDVRSDEEVAQGRADGSVHFPLTELEAGRLPDVAKATKLYVYCRTGRRAEAAAKILRREGWEDVTNIGGLDDWRAAGGRVVS